MGDITANLSRHEFSCECGCGLADPHPQLCTSLQSMVDLSGASSIWITSGSRCHGRNSALEKTHKAAKQSKHLPDPELGNYTLAADCVFRDAPLIEIVILAQRLPEFKDGGIGLYLDDRHGKIDRIHLDVRRYKARWGYIDGAKVTFNEAVAELKLRTV